MRQQVLPPRRVAQEVHVHHHGNDTGKVFLGLLVIAVLGVAAFYLVGWLISVASSIITLLVAIANSVLLFQSRRTYTDSEIASGNLWSATALREHRLKGTEPKTLDPKVLLSLSRWALGAGTFVQVIVLGTLASYATTPEYQFIPLAWLGALAVAASFFNTARVAKSWFQALGGTMPPAKNETVLEFFGNKAVAVAVIGYVGAVFLANFGVFGPLGS